MGHPATSTAGFACFAYIHAFDEISPNRIHVLDSAVHEYVARQVPNHLVNVDHRSTGFILFEPYRLNVGINHPPLTPPVIAYLAVAVNSAALHAVGPVHIRMHHGQNRLDVPGIKGAIGQKEQLSLFHMACRQSLPASQGPGL